MSVNVPGVVAIAVFYLVIAVIGVFFGRKSNKTGTPEELFIASRNLGLFVTSLTIAATIMGGGFILGSAEIIGKAGFVWCIVPLATGISLCVAAFIFLPKIYGEGYTTILDPIQAKYGQTMGAILSVPELLGDLFWVASIFTALGSTLSSVLGIDLLLSIIVSASITTGYTMFGGLYSVAYTDIIQSLFMLCGLVLVLSFSICHPAVDLQTVKDTWYGTIPTKLVGRYLDIWFMFVLGGTTFQAIHQRFLACKTLGTARKGAVLGWLISYVFLIPTVAIGVIGKATDWNMTDFAGEVPLRRSQWTFIFPMIIEYLCPAAVSIIGIGTVSAAVMSSADSSILAAGSILTHNVYGKIFRPQASFKEQIIALRAFILIVGLLGTVLATTVRSVYGLLIIITDISYVIQFPQLCCVLWIPFSNTYGSVAGVVCGLLLRILGGEPVLNLPIIIKYPFYNQHLGQLFPFKTFAMCLSFVTIVAISYITHSLFTSNTVHPKYDIFKCYHKITVNEEMTEVPVLNEKNENGSLHGTDKTTSCEASDALLDYNVKV